MNYLIINDCPPHLQLMVLHMWRQMVDKGVYNQKDTVCLTVTVNGVALGIIVGGKTRQEREDYIIELQAQDLASYFEHCFANKLSFFGDKPRKGKS